MVIIRSRTLYDICVYHGEPAIEHHIMPVLRIYIISALGADFLFLVSKDFEAILLLSGSSPAAEDIKVMIIVGSSLDSVVGGFWNR